MTLTQAYNVLHSNGYSCKAAQRLSNDLHSITDRDTHVRRFLYENEVCELANTLKYDERESRDD